MPSPSFQPQRRGLLLAATLLVLTGCATRDIPPSYQLSPNSGRGVVLVSLTYNGAETGPMNYLVRHLGTNAVTSIPVAHPDAQKAYRLPSGKWTPPSGSVADTSLSGRVAAVELAAGEYRVDGWRMTLGNRTLSSTKPLEETFKVTAGQVVYIGNIHTLFRGNNRYVTMRLDERQRDLALAAQHFPVVKSARVTVDVRMPAALQDSQGTGMDALKDLLNNRTPSGGGLNELPLQPAP